MLYALRRRIALAICPELHVELPQEFISVEVQVEAGAAWRPARIVSGSLHWVPGPLGTEGVKRLEAVRAEYVRANRKVPFAIDAALQAAALQSPDEEMQPSCREPLDGGPNGSEAKLRFRFPLSGRRGEC